MITVVAKSAYQADKVDESIKLFGELVTESNKENGCISYELYQDITDNTILTMIEVWESKEHLEKHMNSDHYKRIIPVVKEFRISSEINIYKKL